MTSLETHRLVDAYNQGWHLTTEGETEGRWRADYGQFRDLAEPRTHRQLSTERGPLRPVKPITDEDQAALAAAFRQAGRRAVPTLGSALEELWHRLRRDAGGDEPRNLNSSAQYAERTLLAGREGSWESDALMHLVWWGNSLNLTGPLRLSVDERRALGPNKRVHREARDALLAMLTRWVTDPFRYTELAETLSLEVSQLGDAMATELRGRATTDRERTLTSSSHAGWLAMTDAPLHPEARLRDQDFHHVYRLLYAHSPHFHSTLA